MPFTSVWINGFGIWSLSFIFVWHCPFFPTTRIKEARHTFAKWLPGHFISFVINMWDHNTFVYHRIFRVLKMTVLRPPAKNMDVTHNPHPSLQMSAHTARLTPDAQASRWSEGERSVATGTSGVGMETVVIVAIGVLATIFLASFLALVVVCRHRYCHPWGHLHHYDSKWVRERERKKEREREYQRCVHHVLMAILFKMLCGKMQLLAQIDIPLIWF